MSTNEGQNPAEETVTAGDGQQQLQVYAAPDLDYNYRDFFTIFVGTEEVIIEFGNRHRSQSNRASIQNRIVLSVQNAFRLQQGLGRSLEEARKRIQEARANQQADSEEKTD